MVEELTFTDNHLITKDQSPSEYWFSFEGGCGLGSGKELIVIAMISDPDNVGMFMDIEMCKRLRDWLTAVIEENE